MMRLSDRELRAVQHVVAKVTGNLKDAPATSAMNRPLQSSFLSAHFEIQTEDSTLAVKVELDKDEAWATIERVESDRVRVSQQELHRLAGNT